MCRGLLKKMAHQLLARNVQNWEPDISACEKGEQWVRALRLLEQTVRQ